jgi:hypothetical protein
MLRVLNKVQGGLLLSEDGFLVGQQQHLLELKRLLGIAVEGSSAGTDRRKLVSEEVGIVGVKGMGGVGKSTMAKALYDNPQVREHFDGKVCWLEVGQNPNDKKICKFQEQILREVCDLHVKAGNPTRGRALIKERLRRERVFICLDNVWEDVKVETTVVRNVDLGPGSRILKTSRIKEAIDGSIHDLEVLDEESAWELFCWHAFERKKPPEVLASLAERAAQKCGGLPLAIRIKGSKVANAEDKKESMEGSLELPTLDDSMIACKSMIRSSFDNLPNDPPGLKDTFLLIAGLWPDDDDSRGF